MRIKTLSVAALALALFPTLSMAQCSDREHQAMSCAEGTVYDANSGGCVKQVSS